MTATEGRPHWPPTGGGACGDSGKCSSGEDRPGQRAVWADPARGGERSLPRPLPLDVLTVGQGGSAEGRPRVRGAARVRQVGSAAAQAGGWGAEGSMLGGGSRLWGEGTE